jgi:3-oxoacyl-ACP reductase-like protein
LYDPADQTIQDPTMRLTDKVTLVTGAARGIGAAVAEAFVAEGAEGDSTWS